MSAEVGSSGQMSAPSSPISTNSSASSLLTTFGSTVADGLYGLCLWSARSSSSVRGGRRSCGACHHSCGQDVEARGGTSAGSKCQHVGQPLQVG